MQVFRQKNDVCLQNFIFLHKRFLFLYKCLQCVRSNHIIFVMTVLTVLTVSCANGQNGQYGHIIFFQYHF